MTSARTIMAACVLGLLWSGALLAQAPVTVDYDTFWAMSRNDQVATFNKITPENKAALVRTQIQRWTDTNRARLNPEQLQLLAEMLAFISTDLYGKPSDVNITRAKELETRATALFSREDMGAAFTREGGAYIPKP